MGNPVMARVYKGFTLIEVLIVVVIVAIMASVAIPVYIEHVLQSRRAEARAAIEDIRNLENEFFLNYKRYGDLDDIRYTSTTSGGYYDLSISAGTLRYTATATAIGRQAKDETCAVFQITSIATLVSFNTNGDNTTVDCW